MIIEYKIIKDYQTRKVAKYATQSPITIMKARLIQGRDITNFDINFRLSLSY